MLSLPLSPGVVLRLPEESDAPEMSVDNLRSRAVAERCGYTLEGIARESWWVGDTVQDMAVYAALAGEWGQ